MPLLFYDIASGPPVTFYAPNPTKARLALNFTGVPYSTQWVELPDIPSVRKSIRAAPVRTFADGSDYHTLPALVDPNTGSVVGDSFDIAQYLERNYARGSGPPGHCSLFPDGVKLDDYASPFEDTAVFAPLSAERDAALDKWAEYARFNSRVDATFSAFVLLMCEGIPFNPATAEQSKAEFVRRAGVASWGDLVVHGEARETLLAQFRAGTETLADMFARDDAHGGPFLQGERPCYGDIIVGGWLRFASVTLPAEEWEEVNSWWGGAFGRLHDALQPYSEAK